MVSPGFMPTDDETLDMTKAEAAVLFDLNNCQVLYAKNAHEKLHPASLAARRAQSDHGGQEGTEYF